MRGVENDLEISTSKQKETRSVSITLHDVRRECTTTLTLHKDDSLQVTVTIEGMGGPNEVRTADLGSIATLEEAIAKLKKL